MDMFRPFCAGTLFWLLASNTYPDYDGYTVYTSKVASQQPAPAWPLIAPEQALLVRTLTLIMESHRKCTMISTLIDLLQLESPVTVQLKSPAIV